MKSLFKLLILYVLVINTAAPISRFFEFYPGTTSWILFNIPVMLVLYNLYDFMLIFAYGLKVQVAFDPKYKQTTDELIKKLEEMNGKEK
jgi:uncharacterized membrane-anchored protein YitT (DUF2179 family)